MVTNGGVLPECLRAVNDAAHLAVPCLSGWQNLERDLSARGYLAQRRVPVGPVRFALANGFEGTQQLFPIPRPTRDSVPQELADRQQSASYRAIRPLATELPEWATDDPTKSLSVDAQSPPKQNLLLIFPTPKPPHLDERIFQQFEFRILKPTTGFWNWFAWQDDWASCNGDTRKREWK